MRKAVLVGILTSEMKQLWDIDRKSDYKEGASTMDHLTMDRFISN